jgi:hypothetical protein
LLLRRISFCVFAVCLLPFAIPQERASAPPPDAQEIIRLSLLHWRRNIDAAHNYTFQQRSVEQQLNKDSTPRKTEIRTYDISIIYGAPYARLIARNDQPLNAKEQQKEEEKLDKFFDKQKGKSEQEREKERTKEKEKFQHEIADELPLMLNYQLVGTDNIDGQPTWVLSATPKPEYHPTSRAGKLLSKISGNVWITKTDFQWVKVEANLSDDFSVGWFLFKLHKGTHLEFEQTRVNDEVWLPKRVLIEGSGRIALKTARFRNDTEFSHYQKFTPDVKITGVAEQVAPPTTPRN